MTLSTVLSGRTSARRSLRIGTALGGTLAIAMLATPAAAQQCGAPVDGRVTCTTAGNPYATGVTYSTATPITVTLNSGVVVQSPVGVRVSSGGDATLAGREATVVSTGNGVNVTSFGATSNVVASIGNVSTTGIGFNGDAVAAVSGNNATVTTGNLSTTGSSAWGLEVIANGTAVATTGTIATTGSNGIGALVNAGTATLTTSNVTTAGANSPGIVVESDNGATVNYDVVRTTGANSIGVNVNNTVGGAVAVRGTGVSTDGAGSTAILARNVGTGALAVATTGTVTAAGQNAFGIVALSDRGAVTVNANNVLVVPAIVAQRGDGRTAIQATGASAAVTSTGTVTSTGATDTIFVQGTTGNASATVNAVNGGLAGGTGGRAVFVQAAQDASATVNGAVSSSGTGGQGVVVTGGRNATVTGTGANSSVASVGNGIVVDAGTIRPGTSLGTGTATVNFTGNVVTSGPTTTGIFAAGPAVSVTAGAVATNGGTSTGIATLSRGGGSTVSFGSVNAVGANSVGVSARDANNGNVTVSGGNVTANGAGSTAIVAQSAGAGNVTVTNTGTVVATGTNGTGIRADTGTTGTATINAVNVYATRAAVFANGGNAAVNTGTGTVILTGAGDAVTANATNGNATATVNAVDTGSAANRAVFVNATQDATANVNGRVRSNGTGAAVVVTGGRNAVVNLGAGSTIAGSGDAVVVTSAANGTSTINTAGTVGNNANGFAIRAVGGAATINNSGTLTGDIQLTAGADRINNSGTFLVGPNPDFGAGSDVFANTGFVRLSPGATAAVTNATFTGLESFQNSGTIDLRNGIVGDVLTIPGTYAGSGGATLGVDVAQGTSAATSDRLVIGGAATGTTTVAVNQVGTGFPAFNAGTTVVQAGAGSTAGAFTLAGGPLTQGLVRYEVVFNAANNTFNLVGTPSDAAFQTLNYLEGVRNLWLKSADVVSAQLRSRRDALWAFGGGDPAGRMWMQIHGSVDTRERGQNFTAFGQTRFVNNSFEQDYFGGQLGFDFTGGVGERGGFAFGVTGGYINSDVSFAGGPDRIGFDVINGGVYGSFSSGNIFANVLGKYDYFWADANSQRAGFQVDEKGGVYGARGEVGIRFGGDSFFIEPAASISWVKSDFDNFTSAGTQIAFGDDDGLRGRFGGRIGGQFAAGGAIVALHVGGNYVHEFQGEDTVTLVSGGQTLSFINPRIRDYGEGVLGMTIGQSEGISGFLEGTYSRSFNRRAGLLDQEGAGGRAGLRLRF